MKQQDKRVDVVIAGAGTVGLTLASALADAFGPSANILVADPKPAAAAVNDFRAYSISAGSQHLLAVLGIWSALEEHAQPVTAIDITDASLDDAFRPIVLSYDNNVRGGEPGTYIVENERLAAAIGAAVARRNAIELVTGTGVSSHAADDHGVTVTLSDGRAVRASVLVAAEGRASPLRQAAGIGVVGHKYPQVGIVTIVEHDKPHRSRAVQHFLPSGPFAILPLKGNRSCVTWSEDENEGRRIVALNNEGFHAELEKRFGYRLGAIKLAGPRGAWPLEMHLSRALIADRLVLVGDAAHLVHPIAGQGLNLGFRDVAALTEVLADAARLGLDIGSSIVLERYERWRRTDSTISAAAFDGLNALFSNDWTLLRTARTAGLGIVDRLPVLKQFFVAEAAGLTGEVPKLLRGEAI